MSTTPFFNETNKTNIDMQNTTKRMSRGQWSDFLQHSINSFIAFSILCILLNLLVLSAILTSRPLRSQPFYWNILNMTIWYLIIGVFVLPLLLDIHFENFTWKHAEIICKMWTLFSIAYVPVSIFIHISTALERCFSLLEAQLYIMSQHKQKVYIILAAIPWVFFMVILMPTILSGERQLRKRNTTRAYCFYLFKESYELPVMSAFCITPICLLVLTLYGMFIANMFRQENRQAPVTAGEIEEEEHTRMSLFTIFAVSLMSISLWLPYVVSLIYMFSCKKRCCMVSGIGYYKAYMASNCPTFLTPLLLSLMLKTIRNTLYYRVQVLCQVLGVKRCYAQDDTSRLTYSKQTE